MVRFRRLVALMDQLAPDRSAFLHALEFAQRLRLPLHGITVPASANLHGNGDDSPTAVNGTPGVEADESIGSRACALACARAGVSWARLQLDGHGIASVRQAVAPNDLLLFDRSLPPAAKQELLRDATAGSAPAILVCPDTWRPTTRALLVDQRRAPGDGFLLNAAALCEGLGVETIVLTIGRSEQGARRRQSEARSALARQGVSASFDSLIGAEVRAALGSVARWRHCQLVVLRRKESPPWWRWLRPACTDWVIETTRFASFLSLADTTLPDPTSSSAGSPRQTSAGQKAGVPVGT